MLWHEDKEKIFALAGDVGALSGGLGGAPRLQPLRVGKERICCWFPWGSGYGVSQKPRPAKFLPKFFLPALFALDHYSFISFYTPLPAEGRAGTERALQHHLGSLKMPRAHPHSTFGNRDNVQTPILQHQALSTAEKEILCGAGEKNARGCELHRSNFITVSSRRYIQPYFYAHT